MRTLVVGGTGMLAGLVTALANDGDHVTVLARRGWRGVSVQGRVSSLPIDYRNTGLLELALKHNGLFDRMVAWIHSDAPEALGVLRQSVTGDVLCVLGSAAADPDFPVYVPEVGEPREVILGFVRKGGHSHWLTSKEISAGVLEALRSGEPRSVVGSLTPWSERP